MFKNPGASLAIIFLGIAIMVSGYYIGNGLKAETPNIESGAKDLKVLNIQEVATYLNMPESEIRKIIQIEKNTLEKRGSFSGKMFPYFVIDDTKYFYKEEIEEWLKETSSNRREYNTSAGYVN